MSASLQMLFTMKYSMMRSELGCLLQREAKGYRQRNRGIPARIIAAVASDLGEKLSAYPGSLVTFDLADPLFSYQAE